MICIENPQRMRVVKRGYCFLEGYPMLAFIPAVLALIPGELEAVVSQLVHTVYVV